MTEIEYELFAVLHLLKTIVGRISKCESMGPWLTYSFKKCVYGRILKVCVSLSSDNYRILSERCVELIINEKTSFLDVSMNVNHCVLRIFQNIG
jgi:hypothetical protein